MHGAYTVEYSTAQHSNALMAAPKSLTVFFARPPGGERERGVNERAKLVDHAKRGTAVRPTD